MSKKIAFVLLAGAFVAAPAFAQFSLPSLGGITGGGSSSGGGDPGAQQDQLVRSYVAANKDVLNAQASLAESVGLKDRAVALKSTADSLGDGATKGNLADADKIQSESSKEISAKLNDGNLQMDEQAKAKYATGMASLGSGVLRYIGLRPQITSFGGALKASPMLAMTKLSSGAYIVTNFPTSAKNVYDTLGYTTAYAKSHDIPVPADATKAISGF